MRIGVLSSPFVDTPPPTSQFAGVERGVADLVNALVGRGHHVHLFAVGTSAGGPADPGWWDGVPGLPGEAARPMTAVEAERRRQEDPDWIPTRAQQISALFAVPQRLEPIVEVVHAQHAARVFRDSVDVLHCFCHCVPALSGYDLPLLATMLDPPQSAATMLAREVPWVAVSRHQAETARTHGFKVRAVIPYGIDARRFTVGDGGTGTVLFLGPVTPPRGAHLAIEAARWAGKRLVIAGPGEPKTDFWKNVVARAIDAGIAEYVGSVSELERDRLLREADALVAPRLYDPLYSRSTLEALACGCPVVAFARGAYPELIEDGVTGYLVRSVQGMAQAIGRVADLKRDACRRYVEQHHSLEGMVDAYEGVYEDFVPRAG